MTTNVQDHVDDVIVIRNDSTHGHSMEHQRFHTIEEIGNLRESDGWKQRLAAMAIAVAICAVLYGLLYLAMHFEQ